MKKYIYLVAFIILTFIMNYPSYAAQDASTLKEKAFKIAKDVVPNLTPNVDYVDGMVYVKYKEGRSERIKNLHSEMRSSLVRDLKEIRWHRVKLTKGDEVNERILEYLKHPDVEYAEPVYIYQLHATPNDPYYTNGSLWGLNKIQASSAWNISTGSKSIVVAVVDSGVAYEHPDLNANIWRNPGEIPNNGIDDDGNGYVDDVYGWDFGQTQDYVTGGIWNENSKDPSDYYGHGTHVAGTIGAVGNNGAGVVGVNWNVQIMALRTGKGTTGGPVNTPEAINYAANNGARVINASWGSPYYAQALYDAISYANSKGVLFVTSAGNDLSNNDSNPQYPANYNLPNIISVAATNSSDQLSSFSNYGASTVHVAAPGEGILSTYFGRKTLFSDNFESGGSKWLPDGTWNLWTILPNKSGDNGALSSPDLCYYNGLTFIKTVSVLPIGSERGVKLEFNEYSVLLSNDYFRIWYYDGLNSYMLGEIGSSGYENLAYDLSIFDSEHRGLNGYLVFSLDTVNNSCYYGLNGYSAIDDVTITAYAPATSNNLTTLQGTSMAAPHVTGLAALILSVEPSLTVSQLKNIILGSVDTLSSLSGKVSTGGRINAYRALSSIPETIATPTALSGPMSGTNGTSCTFSTGGSSSNLGHSIQYSFDWGDGTNSGWLPVGTTSASKSWTSAGTYLVKTQARCSTHTSVVSSWSGTLSVTINSPPSPPTNVQASDGTYMDKVQVTWVASSEATSYTVYRVTPTARRATKVAIGTTSGTTYDDTTASVIVTYYYYVTATNSYGTSGYSAPDTGIRSDGRPSVPTNVQASDGTFTDRVRITWAPSLWATSYTVYRVTPTARRATKVAIGTTSGTTYDDTTASAGFTYYYYVTASNIYGTSGFSASDTGRR